MFFKIYQKLQLFYRVPVIKIREKALYQKKFFVLIRLSEIDLNFVRCLFRIALADVFDSLQLGRMYLGIFVLKTFVVNWKN